MFGESESESPRTGSPWDSLLSGRSELTSPAADASSAKSPRLFPRLVPEVEEVCRITSQTLASLS